MKCAPHLLSTLGLPTTLSSVLCHTIIYSGSTYFFNVRLTTTSIAGLSSALLVGLPTIYLSVWVSSTLIAVQILALII